MENSKAGFLNLGTVDIWGRIILSVLEEGYILCTVGYLAAFLASTH